MVDAPVADTLVQRCFDTLSATALRAEATSPDGGLPVANWHPVTERDQEADRQPEKDGEQAADQAGVIAAVTEVVPGGRYH